jgi:hypothetical protein
MPETTHTGSCHCGKVRFQVALDLDSEFATCNCSICSRAGWVLAFAPAETFTLLAGEDALTDYQFGPRRIHHLFCSTCGIRPFGRGEMGGKAICAVNLRCLEGVDPTALKTKEFDGKSL